MSRHIARIFTIILSSAMIICAVCNLAISDGITWARYPIVSCLFVWGIGTSGLLSEKHRILSVLTALTVLIFPYLYLLSQLTGESAVVRIGYPMAALACGYLWAVYGMHRRIKCSYRRMAGTACILFIPFVLLANTFFTLRYGQPFWEIWDTIASAVLLLTAFFCFRRANT